MWAQAKSGAFPPAPSLGQATSGAVEPSPEPASSGAIGVIPTAVFETPSGTKVHLRDDCFHIMGRSYTKKAICADCFRLIARGEAHATSGAAGHERRSPGHERRSMH